ncbi:MAG: polysaccharide biosynthesis tyrosine autokinase, partial [Chitinophagaceae bacterium]|nr:polysaccharide biosynthesis tyrosine autokinase [Chitinophagaceae bacterium]
LYFSINNKTGKILFNKTYHNLNEWFLLGKDSIRFINNASSKRAPLKYQIFFSLINVKNVARGLANRIEITPSSKLSTVIDLTLEDEIPMRGEDILNELIRVYNKAAIQDKNLLAANTLAFVEQRLNYVVNELDSVEGALQRYKTSKNIVDISEQGRFFLENVGATDKQLSDVNIQLEVLDQVEKYVLSKDETAGIVPSTLGVNDPILSQLLQRLYELEIQYSTMKKTTGENNMLLVSLRDQIEKYKPSILENIRSQRKNLLVSKSNLANITSGYSSMLRTIPQKERELLEISRQQVIKNNIYTFLLQKREETALSFASTVADSRTVDIAEASPSPISPKKHFVYFAAFIAGILLTAGVLTLKELLNTKVLYRKEIEKYVSWPIIGEIAFDNTRDAIVTGTNKRGTIAEQFRHIRTSLAFFGIDQKRKKILITSSVSGEGKTFVAINLAISLALTGKKVVLMEMDLRKPKLSPLLNIKRDIGITSYLIGKSDTSEIIKQTEVNENLHFISAGPLPPNPSELILHERMETLIKNLEKLFDYVIIDTAPVVPVTDAHILSKYCDATLYIVRHGFTSKVHIKRLEENNELTGLKNVSIIFNGLKSRGFGNTAYGYGYGYGYGDGNGYYTQDKKENRKGIFTKIKNIFYT